MTDVGSADLLYNCQATSERLRQVAEILYYGEKIDFSTVEVFRKGFIPRQLLPLVKNRENLQRVVMNALHRIVEKEATWRLTYPDDCVPEKVFNAKFEVCGVYVEEEFMYNYAKDLLGVYVPAPYISADVYERTRAKAEKLSKYLGAFTEVRVFFRYRATFSEGLAKLLGVKASYNGPSDLLQGYYEWLASEVKKIRPVYEEYRRTIIEALSGHELLSKLLKDPTSSDVVSNLEDVVELLDITSEFYNAYVYKGKIVIDEFYPDDDGEVDFDSPDYTTYIFKDALGNLIVAYSYGLDESYYMTNPKEIYGGVIIREAKDSVERAFRMRDLISWPFMLSGDYSVWYSSRDRHFTMFVLDVHNTATLEFINGRTYKLEEGEYVLSFPKDTFIMLL
ncbi:hypothetical protein [Pyrococcus kukulkanii]|uniref:Uncharacterized protein n=1 Tax=Pyrococcus kukulkanii TaxID=1609559 RepID=A0ABV4T7W1_9EURY